MEEVTFLSEFVSLVGVNDFKPESSRVWVYLIIGYILANIIFWVVFKQTDAYIFNFTNRKELLEGILLYITISSLIGCGILTITVGTYLRHKSVEDLQSMTYKQEVSTEAGTAKLKEDGEKGIKVVYDLKKGQPVYYDKLYIKASWFSGTIYIEHQEEKEALFVETASGATKK